MKTVELIAPNKEIFKIAKELKKNRFTNIKISQGLIEEGVRLATLARKKGIDIFVTRGRTAKAIKEANPNSIVVEINITAYDLLRALKKATVWSPNIAIVVFAEMVSSLEDLKELLPLNLSIYFLDNEKDAENKVQEAVKNGYEVIVGGVAAVYAAQKHKIPYVQIETGKEAIEQALEEAKRIAFLQEKEQTRISLLETIANYSSEAVIILDENLTITMCNERAFQILKLTHEEIYNKKINAIWPELNISLNSVKTVNQYSKIGSFNGSDIIFNQIAIKINNKITGIVLSFQEQEYIKEMEAQLRRSIYTEEYNADKTFSDIIGNSSVFQKTIDTAKAFAISDAPIFIVGNTGTGKATFAKCLHNYSRRSHGTFVSIGCASLSKNHFEKDFFGFESALNRAGFFEIAHMGTLFLHEITELSLEAQSTLLNVLKQKRITRMGAEKALPVDFRIIVSTSKNIGDLVAQGIFRADLYYYLNVLQLKLPPLCERREDIPLLAQTFLENSLKEKNRKLKFSAESLQILYRHPWNGNVKELYNIIERLVTMCNEDIINKEYLKELLSYDYHITDSPIKDYLRYDQIDVLRQALKESKSNYTLAAKKLGIDRSTLYRRLKKFGLK